jgi:hypothetical protein
MFKRIALMTMLSAMLLLAGCITIDITNDIHSDGSGLKIMIIGMDQEALESMQGMAGTPEAEQEDPFADTCEGVEEIPGAKCEPYEEGDIKGVKVTAPFANLDELVALSDYETFGADEISYEQDGTIVTLHFTVETGNVGEELASESGGMEEGESDEETEEMARQILALMDIKFYYRAIVPGTILDCKPEDNATVENNKITWEIDILSEEETQEFMVQYDAAGLAGPSPKDTPTPKPPTGETPQVGPESAEGSEEEGGLNLKELPCIGSCLPGLILPLGAAGSALILQRRKPPLG